VQLDASIGRRKADVRGSRGEEDQWDLGRTQGRGGSAHHHAERGLVGGRHRKGDRLPGRRRRLDRLGTDGASIHLGDGRRVRRGRARGRIGRGGATPLLGAAATVGAVRVADRPRQRPALAATTARRDRLARSGPTAPHQIVRVRPKLTAIVGFSSWRSRFEPRRPLEEDPAQDALCSQVRQLTPPAVPSWRASIAPRS
jgi:hypothetical protein